MSWLFSQALVAAYSAASCSAGGASARLNVMPSALPFWHNGKPMACSRFSRFGLTYRISTADHGAELLTWYRAGFRVRTSALREAATGWMASAPASGEKWCGSFAKFDPATSGWRTAQLSLLEDSDESSVTWPRSGSMRNGACSLQPIAAPITSASDCGFSRERWPTPTAVMHKGWSAGHNRADSSDRLDYVVERQAQQNFQRGRLNPTWVEWLIGWPIGWTELSPLAMDKCRAWQQQHSCC